MAVSDKIKALLVLKGKKNSELAEHFGMSIQTMNNKFYRNSFSSADLIKIADFLDCELSFITTSNQKITLDTDDLKNKRE